MECMGRETPETTELAKDFRVQDLIEWHGLAAPEKEAGKLRIADAIDSRLRERYIDPVTNDPTMHGFTMMAIVCLLLETLICFKRGEDETDNGTLWFRQFFASEPELQQLPFGGDDFYRNVRCGLLHQAETKDGLRIHKSGNTLTEQRGQLISLNAVQFMKATSRVLESYVASLRTLPLADEAWIRAERKWCYIGRKCFPQNTYTGQLD